MEHGSLLHQSQANKVHPWAAATETGMPNGMQAPFQETLFIWRQAEGDHEDGI